MAITIVINLEASPESVKLPDSVDLTQTLASSEASEEVKVYYLLAQENDVWFDEPGGPSKTTERTEVIARADTPVRHRVRLKRGSGQKVGRATLRQTIVDSDGLTTPDRTFVVVR